MLSTTSKEWLDGLNLITIVNKFSDSNDEKSWVLEHLKFKTMCKLITRLRSVCTQKWKISYPEIQQLTSGNALRLKIKLSS